MKILVWVGAAVAALGGCDAFSDLSVEDEGNSRANTDAGDAGGGTVAGTPDSSVGATGGSGTSSTGGVSGGTGPLNAGGTPGDSGLGAGGDGGATACTPGARGCANETTEELCSAQGVWESSVCVDGVCDQGRCTDGLEAWWRFDETDGATFLDSSGNNGSCTGFDASRADHNSGRALDLNGTSTYLACGELFADLDYPITLSAWVNWRQGAEDHSYTIVGTDEPSSLVSGARLYLYGGVGEYALLGVQLGNGLGYEENHRRIFTLENGVYPVPAGVWTHIAGVVYSDSVAELYVNGVAQTVAIEGTATLTSLSHYPPTSPTWLGNSPDFDALDRYYDGLIDEVRVHSRALSISEVVALYDADKNGF